VGNQKSDRDRACRGILLFGILLSLSPILSGGENRSERLEFPLEEVPNFDHWDIGHTCDCASEPAPNVVYPAFSSGKPLYGRIRVDMELDDPHSGTLYHFALDESGGTGAGYDRLYVDLNRDGRLSDEAPIAPLRDLPQGRLFTQKWPSPPVWFGYVTFSSRDGAETHSVQTLPRFTNGGYPRLNFQSTTARRGSIEIAKRRLVARIWNSYPIGTRWDRPSTRVRLETPNGSVALPYWLGCDRLRAMQRVEDRLWQLSTTPSGSLLVVEPYSAGWGIVEISLAGRPPQSATFYGSLFARDKAVAVGEAGQLAEHRWVQRWDVPVGDYAPGVLSIRCGPLLFSLSGSDLSVGGYSGRETSPAYPWRIRENETLTLAFADKPEIVFASPADGARLRPGDQLKVAPFLVDPKLNATVRGLRRQSRQEPPPTPAAAPGIPLVLLLTVLFVAPLVVWALVGRGQPRYGYLAWLSAVGLLALAGYLGTVFVWNSLRNPAPVNRLAYEDLGPQATITRANGEIVASGPMPFG
jgi:hypothetical protein